MGKKGPLPHMRDGYVREKIGRGSRRRRVSE